LPLLLARQALQVADDSDGVQDLGARWWRAD
jgi:hypothetical protein